jgi:hypothetical protein
MRFDAAELALLDATEEIEIETRAPDGAVHRTIVWVVVDGGEVFLRSYTGERARWYRETLDKPGVVIHVTERSIAAVAAPATDPDEIRRTSDALARKYDGHGASLEGMLAPEVLETTLRLTPG